MIILKHIGWDYVCKTTSDAKCFLSKKTEKQELIVTQGKLLKQQNICKMGKGCCWSVPAYEKTLLILVDALVLSLRRVPCDRAEMESM